MTTTGVWEVYGGASSIFAAVVLASGGGRGGAYLFRLPQLDGRGGFWANGGTDLCVHLVSVVRVRPDESTPVFGLALSRGMIGRRVRIRGNGVKGREGEAPAEPEVDRKTRLGRSLALP